MKIRVVIPTLNNMFLTTGALLSLRAELGEHIDIVIVDNGSDEETLANLRADIDQPNSGVRFIVNPTPRAYAKSVNMGAALPGEWDALLVSNNDVIYAAGSVAAMVNALSGIHELVIPLSPRDVAAMGITPPKLGRPSELEHVYANDEAVAAWWNGSKHHFRGVQMVTHPYIAQGGYSFLVARPLWDRLKGMDEDFELFGEDYDLFDRAMRFTKIVQAREAFVDHLEHQSVGWLGIERDVRMCKSRFKLAEKRENLREIVSVIIPTFNRTDALFEAIDSVIRQSMPHWKLYVVDDGSKDWDRVQRAARERYRGHESRIWFFHLQDNNGPGAARNFGLDVASGKYFAFLDSDDTWAPNHLEKHLAAHEATPDLVMSYSKTDFAWRWFDEDSKRFRYKPDRHPESQLSDQTYSRTRLDQENFIKTSTVFLWGGLVRRDSEFSEPIRFPVEADHRMAAEDWTFFRLVADRGDVLFVPTVTARTHWSKLADADEHHSSRIIPWATFGDPNPQWLAREVALPDEAIEARVTIVTPTRDRPDEARRLVESIPETQPIILVADGLSSGRLLTPLTQERTNVGLVVVDEPKGPSFARNRGVEAARTPWVWFLDDDDIPVPNCLEWIAPFLDTHDVIVGELIVGTDKELRMAKGLYTSAMLVRPEVFQRATGFDETLRWAEERELFARLEAAGARIARVERPIAIKTAGSFKALALAPQGPNGMVRSPH